MASQQKQIQVNFPTELQGGRYSNHMVVGHTKEEFVLDFMMVAPPTGAVVARVLVSPGHMKRILRALQESVARYEKSHGNITEAQAPPSPIGFKPS